MAVAAPVTNGFTLAHPAVDLGVPCGTPIVATASGIVEVRDLGGSSYGLHIRIRVGAGEFIYAHLSVVYVRNGERVQAGKLIGLSGNTGNVRGGRGCHLHYEIRIAGVPIDPTNSLRISSPIAGAGSTTNAATAGVLAGAAAGTDPKIQAELKRMREDYPFRTRCVPPSDVGGGDRGKYLDLPGPLPDVSKGPLGIPFLNPFGPDPTDLLAAQNPLAKLTEPFQVASYLACMLTDVNTWIRIAFVLGGTVLSIFGIVFLSKELGVGPLGKLDKIAGLVGR